MRLAAGTAAVLVLALLAPAGAQLPVRTAVVGTTYDNYNGDCTTGNPANCSLYTALKQFATPDVHLVVELLNDYYTIITYVATSVEIVGAAHPAGTRTVLYGNAGFLQVAGPAANLTLRNLAFTKGMLPLMEVTNGSTVTLDDCLITGLLQSVFSCPTATTTWLIHTDAQSTLAFSGGTTVFNNSITCAASCIDSYPSANGRPPIVAGHVAVRAGTVFANNSVFIGTGSQHHPEWDTVSGKGGCFIADTAEFEPGLKFFGNNADADGGCFILSGPLKLVAERAAAGGPGFHFEANANRSVVAAATGSTIVGATFLGPANDVALVNGKAGDVVVVVNSTFAGGARLVVDPPAAVATCATAPAEWRCSANAECVDDAVGYHCQCPPGTAPADALSCA